MGCTCDIWRVVCYLQEAEKRYGYYVKTLNQEIPKQFPTATKD